MGKAIILLLPWGTAVIFYSVILFSVDRRLLFRSSSILTHIEGKGPAAFAHKKLSQTAFHHRDGRTNCTSYFIEPVQWMEPALLGVLEGQVREVHNRTLNFFRAVLALL